MHKRRVRCNDDIILNFQRQAKCVCGYFAITEVLEKDAQDLVAAHESI